MCDSWVDSFPTFLKDMGECPEGHTLERVRVNENYEPANCIWLPRALQSDNTTRSIKVRFGNNLISLNEVIAVTGESYTQAYKRLRATAVKVNIAPNIFNVETLGFTDEEIFGEMK